MTKEDIQKIVSMIKTMPDGYKLLRKLLFDYASLKEQNEMLVERNTILNEDIRQYEKLLREEQGKDFAIN